MQEKSHEQTPVEKGKLSSVTNTCERANTVRRPRGGLNLTLKGPAGPLTYN